VIATVTSCCHDDDWVRITRRHSNDWRRSSVTIATSDTLSGSVVTDVTRFTELDYLLYTWSHLVKDALELVDTRVRFAVACTSRGHIRRICRLRSLAAEQVGVLTNVMNGSGGFLLARRYASAGTTSCGPVPMSVCVRMCLLQVGVLSKRLDESGWFMSQRLPSTYSTPCSEEIQVPPKVRVLLSGTLFKTLDSAGHLSSVESDDRTWRCFIETAKQIELILSQRLPWTYPTQCFVNIRASPKIRVCLLPCGTSSQTLDSPDNLQTCYQHWCNVRGLVKRTFACQSLINANLHADLTNTKMFV